jgi:hypothetical protein
MYQIPIFRQFKMVSMKFILRISSKLHWYCTGANQRCIHLEIKLSLNGTRQFCRSGSGNRDPVPFWPLDPGSRMGFFRIPNPYFKSLVTIFSVKNVNNYLKIGPNFFLRHSKNKIIFNFVKFMASKKVWKLIFFTPLFYCCFWIRDPRPRIRDG